MDNPSTDDLVRGFLKGQNLEQIGRVDDAIPLYEDSVRAGFDSSGPYDRLIIIYAERGMHSDVIRVAQASLASVRAHSQKQAWYREHISKAKEALESTPKPT